MRKFYCLFIAVIFLFSLLTVGFCNEMQTIPIKREFSTTITQPGQMKYFYVPEEPLEFDTHLQWQLMINRKSLTSEKIPAFMTIEPIGTSEKQVLKYLTSSSGDIKIPKGTRYKVTIGAGEYSRLLSTNGAEVTLKYTYDEVLINYSQGDKAFTFDFEIKGPDGIKEWNWDWTNGQKTIGKEVSHTFSGSGLNSVVIRGKRDSNLNGESMHNFHFELDVPPVIVLNPKVGPLHGPAELNLKVEAGAIVNYAQNASFKWNFGNGIEVSGSEASNNYVASGNYQLILTAEADNYKVQGNWLVEVTPLTVNPNPTVTPLTGPVPLDITGLVNPQISGFPTQISYSWILEDKVNEGPSFKHQFTEPGNYILVLRTMDKLHPDLIIPDAVFLIKALVPQISLKPTAMNGTGTVPLQVGFQPNVEIKGGPFDLIYNWDFGDGEISHAEKPSHTYKKPGEYAVQLTVTDRLHPGNMVFGSVKVSVSPPELKPFATANVKSGLIPLKVSFNGQTNISGQPCEPLYLWDFGDGTTSIEQNPVHIYRDEGNYTVNLVVKDRLNPGNTARTSLQINTKFPELRLTVALTPTSGSAPLTINGQAFAEKEGGDRSKLKIEWAFDDGTKDTGSEISHTYKNPGTYNVLITVTDEELGISDKKTIKIKVK